MEQNISQTLSLISKIHSLSSNFLKQELEQKGLTELVSSHGNILFQLSVSPNLTMKDIASRIHRDKSTTTVLVKKLETEGYIERQKSSDDNRVIHLNLTEKGLQYTKATSEISETLLQKCFAGFSDTEKELTFSLLQRIKENFDLR